MNTSKMKSVAVATILAAMTVVGSTYPALGGSNSAPVLTVEKSAINKDLNQMAVTKDRVNDLKKQVCDERKSAMNTNATRKQLSKAEADNRLAKAYLCADKRDLVMDHHSYIVERRTQAMNDRFALVKSRFKLQGDLTAGRSAAVDKVRTIVDQKQQLKDDRLALKEAKINRNNDLLAVNKKIEKTDGQNLALLKMEDASAKFQNLAMK
jgi:hypothetical protein